MKSITNRSWKEAEYARYVFIDTKNIINTIRNNKAMNDSGIASIKLYVYFYPKYLVCLILGKKGYFQYIDISIGDWCLINEHKASYINKDVCILTLIREASGHVI